MLYEVITSIAYNKYTFVLTGGNNNASDIIKELADLNIDGSLYGGQSTYGDLSMHMGMITSLANQGRNNFV